MKNKSTYAPQFELPGTEIAFNLRGEAQTLPAPRPQVREDKTREMFEFLHPAPAQYNYQNRKTFMIGFVFAKNSNAAKYQAAKQSGGKPSDYWAEPDAEDTRRFREASEKQLAKLAPLITDPEADLRAIWKRQGVPIYKQDAMISDTSAKATPEFMSQFFPPACASFTPSRTSANHCGNCSIIKSAHK